MGEGPAQSLSGAFIHAWKDARLDAVSTVNGASRSPAIILQKAESVHRWAPLVWSPRRRRVYELELSSVMPVEASQSFRPSQFLDFRHDRVDERGRTEQGTVICIFGLFHILDAPRDLAGPAQQKF